MVSNHTLLVYMKAFSGLSSILGTYGTQTDTYTDNQRQGRVHSLQLTYEKPICGLPTQL